MTDRTAAFILVHGGWRALAAFVIIVAPMYGWILFYYLSTGAWHQSSDIIRMSAPLLATFFIPLILGAWVIGFRKWHILIGAVIAAVIAGWMPVTTVATQLLPNGYINLATVLILLTICIRTFRHWRDYYVEKLPVAGYTKGAMIVVVVAVVGLLALLLPIEF